MSVGEIETGEVLPLRHRATYILQRGVWLARCQACGWEVSDLQRRQASSVFRLHIQDSREQAEIDLRSKERKATGHIEVR
jgi:hypothetical protein